MGEQLAYRKMISYALQGNDLNIFFSSEVGAQFADIYVQVAGIEERIITPHHLQQYFPVYRFVLMAAKHL